MNRVKCYTLFDITPTGVLNHARASQLPMTDARGLPITTEEELSLARNQQRNWETFLQLIGLRAQPTIHVQPQMLEDASLALLGLGRAAARVWTFEFSAEQINVYDAGGIELAALKQDCDGVPLITGLGEARNIESVLHTQGENPNTIFFYAAAE